MRGTFLGLDRFSRCLLKTGRDGRNIERRKIGASFFCVRSFCHIKDLRYMSGAY
jgi:hypothetical protein